MRSGGVAPQKRIRRPARDTSYFGRSFPTMHTTNSPHETTNGSRSGEPISQRVVLAVANRADVQVTELPPLYDFLDPDALNAVVRSNAADLELSFSFAGYRVTVESDSTVQVRQES